MELVQILLPLRDNEGKAFPRESFSGVRRDLVERFGGLTAYMRAPAEGLWDSGGGDTAKDEIVIFEVMTKAQDRAWWRAFRAQLEQDFRQEHIVIRATPIELI